MSVNGYVRDKRMRKQNIVIFSAGESIRNGRIDYIKSKLSEHHIDCTNWDELFYTANDMQNIALLPLLIKKIPTFDFALIVAEGVDEINLRQSEKVKSMRDNVVFEIGLCVMALGAKRVILFSEQGLRLPEDLIGKGGIGIHQIEFEVHNIDYKLLEVESLVKKYNMTYDYALAQIASYIRSNAQNMSPVYVGASVALAESYFYNFLKRLVTYLDQPIIDPYTHQEINIDLDKVSIRVCIPTTLQDHMKTKIQNYYCENGLKNYYIENAGTRSLLFKAKFEKEHFIIMDIPTSITASYSIVNAILNLDSDDIFDDNARERYMLKELDMFQYTLSKFLNDKQLNQSSVLEKDLYKNQIIVNRLSQIHLMRIEIK